ncbi:MAG: hypothetical protein QME77_10135 [bacterium]|nr:hypothetical protein [bacterium]
MKFTYDLVVDGRSVETGELVATPPSVPPGATAEEVARAQIVQGYTRMRQSIRSWGIALLVLGAIHFIGRGFLSTSWGALLILVALASFYFREAAMFVVYATSLAWAAIGNLLGGTTGWSLFALVQLFLSFQTFKEFRAFRAIQAAFEQLSPEETQGEQATRRAARFFPWGSLLLGLMASGGSVIFLGTLVYAMMQGAAEVPQGAGGRLAFILDLGVLGVAVGLGSLLSGFRGKTISGIGIATSLVPMLLVLAIFLL